MYIIEKIDNFTDNKQSIKKELKKIDNIISLVNKIEHEESRKGLLVKLKIMRDEIASKIGK